MTKATRALTVSLLLLLQLAVSAQVTSSTSSVTGVVADPNGAAVAGATVTLTDTRTSKELTTTTDDQGVYRFAQVQPGQGYTISVTAGGLDRKSTRLNSSHANISYAVFCLKKKK